MALREAIDNQPTDAAYHLAALAVGLGDNVNPRDQRPEVADWLQLHAAILELFAVPNGNELTFPDLDRARDVTVVSIGYQTLVEEQQGREVGAATILQGWQSNLPADRQAMTPDQAFDVTAQKLHQLIS